MKTNLVLRSIEGVAGDNPGWPGQAPATAKSLLMRALSTLKEKKIYFTPLS